MFDQYDIRFGLNSININSVRVSAANNRPQDSQLNDTVTIITSVTNYQTVKSFGDADYQSLKFSPGSEFLVCQQPVHDLQSLASIIGGLEGNPTKAVMRGLPLLSENDPVARQSQNFSSISHHWCMIDIDSLPWDGDLQDQKAMLEYASSQLPPEFQQADCLYHFSSSMGAKAGMRMINRISG